MNQPGTSGPGPHQVKDFAVEEILRLVECEVAIRRPMRRTCDLVRRLGGRGFWVFVGMVFWGGVLMVCVFW